MFPMRLILLPFHGPTLILVPDLLRVLNHALVFFFLLSPPEFFPLLLAQCDLQEMAENCDYNKARGPVPDHSCLFNHTEHSSSG